MSFIPEEEREDALNEKENEQKKTPADEKSAEHNTHTIVRSIVFLAIILCGLFWAKPYFTGEKSLNTVTDQFLNKGESEAEEHAENTGNVSEENGDDVEIDDKKSEAQPAMTSDVIVNDDSAHELLEQFVMQLRKLMGEEKYKLSALKVEKGLFSKDKDQFLVVYSHYDLVSEGAEDDTSFQAWVRGERLTQERIFKEDEFGRFVSGDIKLYLK